MVQIARPRLALALLVPGIALALAACGGSSTNSSASASVTGGTGSSGAAGGGSTDVTAYRTCMSKHGVTLPTAGFGGGMRPSGTPTGTPNGMPGGMAGGGGSAGAGGPGGGAALPSGVDATAFQKAEAACASLRPTGFPGGRPAASIGAAALKAFSSCMKDHGVTATNGLQGLDRADSKVAAALRTCSVLLPAVTPTATPAA